MAAIHSLSANPDPQLAQMRLPPHSLEAEQAVLGGLLLDNSAWDRIGDVVAESDLYRLDHRQILRAIVRQIAENRPADAVTVAEALQSMGQLESVGGLAYIVALASNTPSAANIRRYAEIVRERSVMRRLAEVATGIADTAYSPAGRSASQLLDEAEAKVFEIAESGSRGQAGFTEIKPLLKEVVERIDELYHRDNDSGITGVPTGFHDLDQKTSGFQPGDLIIVAGRPSMGKTAFSLNIAENVALDTGLPVAVFSMEMGGTQLVMRMIGSVGKLDQHRLRTGKLGEDDWQRLTYALGKLNEAPVYIGWAGENRSALIRIPRFTPGKDKAVRAELRCPDPSGNPYLQFNAMLSAAMDGVDKKMTPPKPLNNVNIYSLSMEERAAMGIRQLPGSLLEALNELEKDDVIKNSLGSEMYGAFMRAKRAEWDEYRIFVTDWEKQRYLETA